MVASRRKIAHTGKNDVLTVLTAAYGTDTSSSSSEKEEVEGSDAAKAL